MNCLPLTTSCCCCKKPPILCILNFPLPFHLSPSFLLGKSNIAPYRFHGINYLDFGDHHQKWPDKCLRFWNAFWKVRWLRNAKCPQRQNDGLLKHICLRAIWETETMATLFELPFRLSADEIWLERISLKWRGNQENENGLFLLF